MPPNFLFERFELFPYRLYPFPRWRFWLYFGAVYTRFCWDFRIFWWCVWGFTGSILGLSFLFDFSAISS